jgi:hypothetical protein
MKKLFAALFVPVLLAGCGTSAGLYTPVSIHNTTMNARSAAGVSKGFKALFEATFNTLDKDQSGTLTLDELPPTLTIASKNLGGVDAKTTMNKLDLNMDGKVTLREFERGDLQTPMINTFRYEMGLQFAKADVNGDRELTADEVSAMPNPPAFADLDLNSNNKVTLSEFEDAMIQIVANGGGTNGPTPNPPAPQPAPSDAPTDAPPAPAGN